MDALAEAITGLLDGQLQLGGTAVAVGAPSWDELLAVEYPTGSGQVYAALDGTLDIEVEALVTVAP